MENKHRIDFRVPLSGSQLFDMHAYVTAQHICSMFPGLQFEKEYDPKAIHIFGELNDFWFDQWNKALFSIGEFNA